MRILAIDIETAPLTGHTFGLFNQNISLGQMIEPISMLCFAARWIDDPRSKIFYASTFHDGVEAMRGLVWDLLDEADALLSWNGKAFDTKHMNRELLLGGFTPPSPFKEIDLLQTARSQFKFTSNKLDHVAQQLGLPGKVKHEGFGLWLKCMAGDAKAWDRMRRYNLQDVHLLVDLYKKLLPWIKNHPSKPLYEGLEGLLCPRCASPRLQSRGPRVTSLGTYQRYQCQKCGGWCSSGKRLTAVDLRLAG